MPDLCALQVSNIEAYIRQNQALCTYNSVGYSPYSFKKQSNDAGPTQLICIVEFLDYKMAVVT